MFTSNIFNGSMIVKLFLFLITICLIYISLHISTISSGIPLDYTTINGNIKNNNSLKNNDAKNFKSIATENQNNASSPEALKLLNETDMTSNNNKDNDSTMYNDNKAMNNYEGSVSTTTTLKPVEKIEILYVSRHDGTISNFKYIADKLGFDFYRLAPMYDFDKRPDCFDNGECASYFETICRKYKYIVISDIIPDAFPFIINNCSSKVILEITNRFDLFVPNEKYQSYLSRFNKAIKEKENITVVANNPFESYYACRTGVHIENHYIIRPAGVAPQEVLNKAVNEKQNEIVIVDRSGQDKAFSVVELDKRNVSFKLLPWHYGGPLVLASYKAMLLLPYQVSVMKMMENFRYGVAMLIPSETLFRELIKSNNYDFPAKDLADAEDGLRLYTEWYNDEFKDLFVYFDSWDDIPYIVETVDFEAVKRRNTEFIHKYEKKILNQWKQALGLEPNTNMIHRPNPICQSIKGFFYS